MGYGTCEGCEEDKEVSLVNNWMTIGCVKIARTTAIVLLVTQDSDRQEFNGTHTLCAMQYAEINVNATPSDFSVNYYNY